MLGTARDEATPLLGRLEEQSLLTSLLDDVARRGQALVLRGEPGIGKSRLRAECERTSRERGRRGHTRAAACALDRGINGFGLPESVRLLVERRTSPIG